MKLRPRHFMISMDHPEKTWDENPLFKVMAAEGWTIASTQIVEAQRKERPQLLILLWPPPSWTFSSQVHRGLFLGIGMALGLAAATLAVVLS